MNVKSVIFARVNSRRVFYLELFTCTFLALFTGDLVASDLRTKAVYW